MTVALNIGATSAIYDWSTLKTEWALRLDRSDLDDHFPQFVQLTESFLSRRLRVMDGETLYTVTTSSETLTLPSDFLQMRSIHIEGSSSPDYPLRGMSPAALVQQFSGDSDTPVAYAQIGTTLKLAPPPASEILLSMVYVARFTPLTETSVSNWILEQHPDLYFYGCLAQACDYIQDTAGFAKYSGLLAQMTEDLVRVRARDRWGSGPLVPNAVRQVRGASC